MARSATGTIREKRGKDGKIYRSLRFSAEVSGSSLLSGGEPPGRRARAPSRSGRRRARDLAAAGATRAIVADADDADFPRVRGGVVDQQARRSAPAHPDRLRVAAGQPSDPAFADHPLDQITVREIERYHASKRGQLSPRSINMTVTLLNSILDRAVRLEILDRNRAKGERLPEQTPTRTQLDSARVIEALLKAASELDRRANPGRQHVHRRAMLTTLLLSGLRIEEFCALRWGDVDLASGWINVPDAKTDAGVRQIKIRGVLRGELLAIKPVPVDPQAFVFPTSAGKKFNPRTCATGRSRPPADRERCSGRGWPPAATAPDSALVTSHVRLDPVRARRAPDHGAGGARSRGGSFTLQVYAKAMRREPGEIAALKALVYGAGDDPQRALESTAEGGVHRESTNGAETGLKAPKSTITGRHPAPFLGGKTPANRLRARMDSNHRPFAPEANALSPELRAVGEQPDELIVEISIVSDTHMRDGRVEGFQAFRG